MRTSQNWRPSSAPEKKSLWGKLFFLAFIAMLLIPLMTWLFGQGGIDTLFYQQVQAGEIVSCKHCQKEISNTVKDTKVLKWEAKQYGIKRWQSYCKQCGEQKVAFTVSTCCRRCGNVYASHQEFALRKNETKSKAVADGFCSEQCEHAAKVDATIDRVSERTGDIIGRIGRGIADGIKKH
jgi:hypothetical protein